MKTSKELLGQLIHGLTSDYRVDDTPVCIADACSDDEKGVIIVHVPTGTEFTVAVIRHDLNRQNLTYPPGAQDQ